MIKSLRSLRNFALRRLDLLLTDSRIKDTNLYE